MSCKEGHFSVGDPAGSWHSPGSLCLPLMGIKGNVWAWGLWWCWQRLDLTSCPGVHGNDPLICRLWSHIHFPFLGSCNWRGDNLMKEKKIWRGKSLRGRLLSIFKVSQPRGIIFTLAASYSRLTREWWQSLGANHILLKPKLPSHYIHPLSISTFLFLFSSP